MGVSARTAMRTTAAGPDAGRRHRLEQLFAVHGPFVYGYARRRASAEDADEVVSETFLVAWRRIDEVPPDALPWLLVVARNSLANLRRSQARQAALRGRLAATPRLPAQEEEPGQTQPTASYAVLRALAALSAAEREAITLLAWEDLTPAEAAIVLGCSRSAIYLRLHRARRRIRHDLEITESAPPREPQ